MKVLAEGVEMEEQADWLRKLGCGYAHGYYFSQPLSGSDAEAFMQQYIHEH